MGSNGSFEGCGGIGAIDAEVFNGLYISSVEHGFILFIAEHLLIPVFQMFQK